MPPHCDSLDGPVVTAARRALEERDVDRVLPYVSEEGEPEVREAFELTAKARTLGQEAQEVADRWFFETVVRVHRSGEGAPFTGLKPAGLDVGPVIPAAERALDAGSADELAGMLCEIVREQVEEHHGHAMALKEHAAEGVAATRAYVEACLGLQVWAHHLYKQAIAVPHAPTRRS
ncbi:DUF6448 family protein [Streptomyces chromofuscus]|uniref:Uncharacterized protein n=1 Tax=Streptomyces chromofuscus TaxID=42881 RepID=A0A7M2T991_STRCW|nr:DUF6448 family protein [Streptomyces chromofuscus]QOV44699.1 hypothetical protein IPT68_01290 [Streptomyces chromofuscus]GGT01001.1 hypothetical protein GCM10010254_21550 [Streptomyces chromofuscus]